MAELTNLGNFKDYAHRPRKVASAGFCHGKGLLLKLYDMYIPGAPGSPITAANEFLREEIERGRLTPLSGLGFAIISKDMINAVRWDDKYPIVMNNQIYEYNPEELVARATAKKLDVNQCGSFCVWEAGIVAHEKDAWIRYLAAGRSQEDKEDYLNDFINGSLSPR